MLKCCSFALKGGRVKHLIRLPSVHATGGKTKTNPDHAGGITYGIRHGNTFSLSRWHFLVAVGGIHTKCKLSGSSH